ncbi:MAG: 5'-nucleotidase C-terminal domain-containing protein [Acidobacteria bacterium]|nr:5'-nucleotidase C-terminal domain-containing protein [Acidobacteriota bacterium]
MPAWPDGAARRVHITLLGSTDLHGNIFPVDYYTHQPANRGLAKIATLVREARGEQKNVLLLDSGDTIQGTPLAYYFARKDTSKTNPTIVAMNALGYDAMAVGNHEFNFGLDVLWKAKREAKFPWLAANIKQTYKSGVEHIEPYIIKNVGGVRVAIIGFITPGVPRWEIPAHYRGYEFENIVDAAKRVIPEARKKADLVVVIAHSGLERDPQTGETYADQMDNENAVGALAEQVPGIDVIFFGHSHRELPTKLINGVLLVQAKNWGQSLARADVELERRASGWKVASKRSTVIPVTDAVAADPEILKLAQPYHEATEAYLDTPIATSSKALDASTARYEDHPFVDLIHKVQMEYGKADVSLATMFYSRLQIPAGQVTLRQIAGLYIYENTLYTVEMTGAQLRQVLEHAAEFFPAWPFPEGGRVRLPGYNADSAEGVEYTMDLTQPAGQRIRDLRYKGKPLADDTKLRVATNNYRYAGGGHYTALQGLPVVYRSPMEIRELIIESVSRTGAILPEADGNWKIVPREAFEALVREARQRELGNSGGP